MTLITYARRPVAMAGPDRLYLAAHINRRPDGDPLKTFVCFLALYARDVQLGMLPAEPHHYLPRRAERYARAALMPDAELAAIDHRTDRQLAEHFRMPVEQVAHRRADLTNASRRPALRRRTRSRCSRVPRAPRSRAAPPMAHRPAVRTFSTYSRAALRAAARPAGGRLAAAVLARAPADEP